MKAKEIRQAYWDYLKEFHPDLAKQRRSRLKQNDYCTDIRCYFVDFVDNLMKSGQITEEQADNITL